jgi:hypothetical protein
LAVVLVCSRRKRAKARVSEKAVAEMPSDLYTIPEMGNTARPVELESEEGVRRVYEIGS